MKTKNFTKFIFTIFTLVSFIFLLKPLSIISVSAEGDENSLRFDRSLIGDKEIEYSQDEILIKLKKNVEINDVNKIGIKSIENLNKKYGVIKVEKIFKEKQKIATGKFVRKDKIEIEVPDLTKWFKLKLSKKDDLLTILEEYKRDPNIEYAERNYIFKSSIIPNDPYYSSTGSWGQSYSDLWGLKPDKLNCEQAWGISQGEGVIVAVVDTGIDYNHEDIATNVWINPDEIPSNGLDDDGNGFIDDVKGWDFTTCEEFSPWGVCNITKVEDNDTMDDGGHGSHVAGTIAATGNNEKGIIGVAPKAKVMAVKGLNKQGAGYSSWLADAIIYAADNGADVISNSWGVGPGPKPAIIYDAIQYAYAQGSTIVVAAGNSSDDVQFFSPAGIKEVITVASSDHDDIKSVFSNWGYYIDVVAPGEDILSLRANGTDLYGDGIHIVNTNYYRASGTSMATPHVSGLAALILSKHPEFTNDQVRQAIRVSSDDLGDPGFDKYYGYGRVNAYKALQVNSVSTAWIKSPEYHSFVNGIVNIIGTASGNNFKNYKLEYGIGEYPTTFVPLFVTTNQVINGVLFSLDAKTIATGVYTLKLTVEDTLGNKYEDKVLVRINDSVLDNGWLFDINNWDSAFITPTFADINGDNYKEIIAPLFYAGGTWGSYEIGALDHNGKILDNWQFSLIPASEHFGPPAVGDINKDGKSEIFINTHQGIYAFDYSGNQLSGWPKETSKNFDAPVVLADINRDGYLEIISLNKTRFNTQEHAFLYVWDRNGSSLPGFPVDLGKTTQASTNLAVGDLDRDNYPEIVVPINYVYCGNSNIDAYNHLGNKIFSYGPINNVCSLYTSIGDVNNDGSLDIVYKTNLAVSGTAKVGVLDKNGNKINEWVVSEGWLETGEPVFGDLDGDVDLEIVDTIERPDSTTKKIYAWHHNGTLVSGWPIEAPVDTFTPVLADINGDNKTEIITSFSMGGNSTYAFNGNGGLVSGFPLNFYQWPMAGWQLSVNFKRTSIQDIDNDGKLELAVAPGQGLLYVVELPNSLNSTKMDWPVSYHDKQHTASSLCYVELGASPQCEGKIPNSSWCDGNTKKSCNSACQYSEKNCQEYGSNYICLSGTCSPRIGGGGMCRTCFRMSIGPFVIDAIKTSGVLMSFILLGIFSMLIISSLIIFKKFQKK